MARVLTGMKAMGGAHKKRFVFGHHTLLGNMGFKEEVPGERGRRSRGSGDDDEFLTGLEIALEARMRRKPSPGTGGTGCSGEEDDCSDSDEHDMDEEEVDMPIGELRRLHVLEDDQNEISCVDSILQGSWIIDPRHKWKMRWDIFVGFFIFYTLLVLPWRIGFDQDAKGAALTFDYAVDVLFFIDLVLCFRTGYYSETDAFISDPFKIAKRYLTTFFIPDFLSCVPLDSVIELATGNKSGNNVRSIKFMKFVRLIRLMKLMRLLKLQSFLLAMESRLDLNPHMIRMVKLMIKIIFLAHLLSCCWHFITLPICGHDDIPEPCPAEVDPDEATNWVRYYGVDHFTDMSRYIASFHFVTATMMAVGYGDISAKNTVERVFSVITQLVGATAFGFILSAVTTLLDSANPRESEYHKRMGEVKEWLASRNIPKQMRRTIREHFAYVFSKKSVFNEVDYLGNMPTQLRNQIVQQSYARWFDMVERAWPNEDVAFCAELILQSKPQQVATGSVFLEPGEICSEIFIVVSGCLEARLSPGEPVRQPDDWARNCLRREQQAIQTPTDVQGNAGPAPSAGGEVEEDVLCGVLCGFFQSRDLLGLLTAFPLLVAAKNRSELLGVHKDVFLNAIGRFPGAIPRHLSREQNAYAQVMKVLESDDTCECTQRAKALILVNWKAVPISEVPPELLKGGRRSSGFGGTLFTPSATPPTSPKRFPSTGSGSANSGSFVRQGTIQSQSGSVQLGFSPFSPTAGMSKGFRRSEVVVHTLRLSPGTSEVMDTDETEDEMLSRWIIPPFHRHKFKWDAFVGVLIIYSVLTIPWRIGFGIEASGGWLVFDWLVDALFCIDMVLCFRTAFIDADGLTITIPRDIRNKYLGTWFLVDFFSTFPVDRIVEACVSGAIGTKTRALKLVRIIRLVRLLKLARILKMGRLMQTFEEVAELSPIVVRCVKLGTRLAMLAHLLGCFWYYISVQQDPTTTSACEWGLLDCNTVGAEAETWWQSVGIKEDQKWEQYVASLYWSFTTMTTVGYGDISPKSDLERMYAIMSMIFGATIFGYIIGSIAALAGQEKSMMLKFSRGTEMGECAKTKRRLMMIRDYCDEQNMSKKNQDMVRQHYQFYYQQKPPFNEASILSDLPSALRKEVLLYMHRHVISVLGLFAGPDLRTQAPEPLPDWFIAWVVQILEPQVVSAGEDVLRIDDVFAVHEIFFLYIGECEAYLPHGWTSRSSPSGGQCDTGGSADVDDQDRSLSDPQLEDTFQSGVSSPSCRDKIVAVFTPGCMFGMEQLLPEKHKYRRVRCSLRGPSFLYVLKQATIAEVTQNSPELAMVLRGAVTNAFIKQIKSDITLLNLEMRKHRNRSSEASNSAAKTSVQW